MDQCEELAAAYGRLPREILQMPWVAVRECWASYTKRQRRQFKLEAAMRGLDTIAGMTGGSASPEPRRTGSADGLSGTDMDRLAASGMPVVVRRPGGGS